MAVRVIHFGPDDCHRLTVLRSAGYSVDACNSLGQLHASLLAGGVADAVVMSDGEGVAPAEVISLARTHSSAPVVLFRGTNRAYEDSMFDLVVHTLTPPEVWLTEVDAVIAKHRVLRAHSSVLTLESARPRQEAAIVARKLRRARQAGFARSEGSPPDTTRLE